jgi:hypothetical protein
VTHRIIGVIVIVARGMMRPALAQDGQLVDWRWPPPSMRVDTPSGWSSLKVGITA